MRFALGLALLISVYAALVFATAASKFAGQFGKHSRHDRADALNAVGAAGDLKSISHARKLSLGEQEDHAV